MIPASPARAAACPALCAGRMRLMSSLLLAVAAARHHHGLPVDYAGLGLAAGVGWVGVPGVGEAALIAAGVLAASGRLDLGEVVAVAFVAAAVGGVVGWLIGLK